MRGWVGGWMGDRCPMEVEMRGWMEGWVDK